MINSFNDAMAGECRIGRNESQDISIRDPSVSGCHAVIDIVDLPDAGGKRVALKVMKIDAWHTVVFCGGGCKRALSGAMRAMIEDFVSRRHWYRAR